MNRFQEYLEQVSKKVKGIKGTNVTFTIDEIKDIIRNLEGLYSSFL